MRDGNIIRGFGEHDKAINTLHTRLQGLEKAYDKLYLNFLIQQMMWDCLMGLLVKKAVFSEGEFDAEMKALQEATQKAMEADAKKRAEAKELLQGKVTVLSETPAIPVVK
jgi:hypothetical protein